MRSPCRHPVRKLAARTPRTTGRGTRADRPGKILALFAIALPALLAMAGLLLDGGGLLNDHSMAQHAADAAASAGARSLYDGASRDEAIAIAEEYVQRHNGLTDAEVTVSIPPVSGPFAGDSQSVEVEVRQRSLSRFLSFLGGGQRSQVRARAVARHEASTAGAALVVLDPDPPPIAVPAVGGILPPLPAILGGFEVLGVSRVQVDGAVLVNTQWGGLDENGSPAGESAAPPWGIACPGVLINEKLRALDIRVAGGIDDPDNFGPFSAGDPHPVRANSLPVPDPLAGVPVPTFGTDPVNVSDVLRGGVRVADLPLINPPRTLQPGIYDYLQVVSGNVTFAPGIYIIRDADPLTGISLSLLGGTITADGVLFYITNSPAYSPASGAPDDSDGETVPSPPGVLTILPSTVINVLLPGSTFRGLDDPSSPFDGMLIYQRRTDRRPVALVNNLLLGGSPIDGLIYAKWGHVILVGSGFRETRAVAGTLRLLSVTPSLIAPTRLLPPAHDVFIVD